MFIRAVAVGLCIFFWIWGPSHPTAQAAVSSATMQVLLYIDQPEAYVNGMQYTLDAPATIVEGKTYVPIKFLSERFGIAVQYDVVSKTANFRMQSLETRINFFDKTASFDGIRTSMEPTFRVINNRLMGQLTWFTTQLNAKVKYDHSLRRIEVTYTPMPSVVLTQENSSPIAKFTVDRSTYRLGERIKYIDLSYDPDGDGIATYNWKNAREAFFVPGKHEVTLQVTDSKNNTSQLYRKTITVVNEVWMTPLEFAMNEAKIRTLYKFTTPTERATLVQATKLPMTATPQTNRKLLVSDSPENVREYGVLYRDTVNGLGRLYANHINETQQRLQLAIVATNYGTVPITIKTTRQGEVYPSTFVNLIGHQATVDFMLDDVHKDDVIVGVGQSVAYTVMPDFFPGQGVNLIYDIETTGELTFDFVAMLPGDGFDGVRNYPTLPYDNHVRGSFQTSTVDWIVDGGNATQIRAITIGDNQYDQFVRGYDPLRGQEVPNYGNYGVVYNIRVMNPGKVTVALLARGGPFKGPFVINQEMILAPSSGVVTPLDGIFLLTRTTGLEPYVDIQFSPPAGSAFPVDVLLYPLR